MIHVDFSKLFIDLNSVSPKDAEGLVLIRRRETPGKYGNSVKSTYGVYDPKEPSRELARVTMLIPSTKLNNKRSR